MSLEKYQSDVSGLIIAQKVNFVSIEDRLSVQFRAKVLGHPLKQSNFFKISPNDLSFFLVARRISSLVRCFVVLKKYCNWSE